MTSYTLAVEQWMELEQRSEWDLISPSSYQPPDGGACAPPATGRGFGGIG